MKRLLLTLCILTPLLSWAQPTLPKNVADSLWRVWKDESMPDTARLQAIEKYAWDGYLYTKPDSAFYFAQLQYDFALEKGMKKQMGSALNCQGVSFQILGNYPKSLYYYSQSLKIQKEIMDKPGMAYSLMNIGIVYANQGDYNKAINYYSQSLEIQKEIGTKRGIAISYGNIGNIYNMQGDYTKAIDYYSKSLRIFEEVGYKLGMSNSLNNLGNVYNNQGDHSRAIDYFFQCLKITEEIGNKKGSAGSLGNIAVSYNIQGDLNKAIDYFSKCLKIFEEIGDKKGIANSLNNIGSVYVDLGDNTKALYHYSQGLKIREDIGDKLGISNSLYNVGKIYAKQGRFAIAIEYSSRALSIAREIGSELELQNASRSLIVSYTVLDSISQAVEMTDLLQSLRIKALDINFSSLSEQQKEKYFTTMQDDFDLLFDFALQHPQLTKQTERVYNNTLLTKGLLLKSSTAMRNAILNSGDSVLTGKYNDWIALKRRIAKSYSNGGDITAMEAEANELEKTLVKGSQEFSSLKKVQSLTWKDVQSSLKAGEVAVEFIRFNHKQDYRNDSSKVQLYAALIIDNKCEHPAMVKLFEESELQKILGTFPGNNLSYIEQIYGTKTAPKNQLYNLIWKPLEGSLTAAKKVYVSPVGLLHKISFAALAKEKDVYLCDLYQVENMSSTGKIAMPDEVAFDRKSSVTLFGGVDYNTDSSTTQIWSYLEGTLTEAEMIKKALRKQPMNYYTKKEASEANFKSVAPNSLVLHIATHGFFFPDPNLVKQDMTNKESAENIAFRGGASGFGTDRFVQNRNPFMRSGLVLAGANDVWSTTTPKGEDGVLTAEEVANIDLRKTQLVVLSACETGLGDIKGSEGVYGLQRAFKMAGAKYLIMSLWQVPDKETAEFMTTFYKHLMKSQDIKASFAKTQKEMRKKYDPYFWAAFVLVE